MERMMVDWTDRKKCETPEEYEEAIADMFAANKAAFGEISETTENLADMIRIGAVIDSGVRRNGEIVWALNEKL
jgi:hypothetical protein